MWQYFLAARVGQRHEPHWQSQAARSSVGWPGPLVLTTDRRAFEASLYLIGDAAEEWIPSNEGIRLEPGHATGSQHVRLRPAASAAGRLPCAGNFTWSAASWPPHRLSNGYMAALSLADAELEPGSHVAATSSGHGLIAPAPLATPASRGDAFNVGPTGHEGIESAAFASVLGVTPATAVQIRLWQLAA